MRVLSSITVMICNYAPSGRMSRWVHHRRLSFPAQQGMICRGYAGAVKGSALGTHIKLENNTIEGMNTGCLFLTNRLPHAVDVLMPLCVERLELPSIDGTVSLRPNCLYASVSFLPRVTSYYHHVFHNHSENMPVNLGLYFESNRESRNFLTKHIHQRVLSLLLNCPRGRAHTIDAESWRRASGFSITVWVYSSLEIVGSFQAVHLIWGSHRHMARHIDVCNFILIALMTRKFGRPVKGPVERAYGHRVQHSHAD